MNRVLVGGCMCGDVAFTVNDDFKDFYLCHCKQCKQLTGSAFAANIITDIDNITWHSGKDNVSIFEHPSRNFSKSFCRRCGSALPFINKTGTSLIVPAGCLNEPPEMIPQANVFVSEEASWLRDGIRAKKFPGFADK